MGESIAEVAAGLTKAQQTIVFNRGDVFGMPYDAHLVRPLIRRGLFLRQAERGFQVRWALTTAGEAVRNHLISQGADHNR